MERKTRDEALDDLSNEDSFFKLKNNDERLMLKDIFMREAMDVGAHVVTILNKDPKDNAALNRELLEEVIENKEKAYKGPAAQTALYKGVTEEGGVDWSETRVAFIFEDKASAEHFEKVAKDKFGLNTKAYELSDVGPETWPYPS